MNRLRGMSLCSYLLRAVATVVLTLFPSVTVAQTAIQIPLQFDFVNPGAKSLALGGAFTGLADDATAGFANPAGLRPTNVQRFVLAE